MAGRLDAIENKWGEGLFGMRRFDLDQEGGGLKTEGSFFQRGAPEKGGKGETPKGISEKDITLKGVEAREVYNKTTDTNKTLRGKRERGAKRKLAISVKQHPGIV